MSLPFYGGFRGDRLVGITRGDFEIGSSGVKLAWWESTSRDIGIVRLPIIATSGELGPLASVSEAGV